MKLEEYEKALVETVANICKNAGYAGMTMPKLGVEFLEKVLEEKYDVAALVEGCGKFEHGEFVAPEEISLCCSVSHYLNVEPDKYFEGHETTAWDKLVLGTMKLFIRHEKEERESFIKETKLPIVQIAKELIKKPVEG